MTKPNTIGNSDRRISRDTEDKILALLPKAIRDWIKYEAPYDVCVAEIAEAVVQSRKPDIVLHTLRVNTGIDTRKTYGPMHPQASWL